MIPAAVTETDLEMVVRAGEWREIVGATDEERDLAGACAVVEAELREREWATFEQLLRYIVDGRVVPPATEPERLQLLRAVVELSWHHRVPVGRADEAEGCQGA